MINTVENITLRYDGIEADGLHIEEILREIAGSYGIGILINAVDQSYTIPVTYETRFDTQLRQTIKKRAKRT